MPKRIAVVDRANMAYMETPRQHDALIISNDRYEPYQKANPWIEKRRVPVMIIREHAELYEPRLEKNSEQS